MIQKGAYAPFFYLALLFGAPPIESDHIFISLWSQNEMKRVWHNAAAFANSSVLKPTQQKSGC